MRTITISTPGPQGPVGPQGIQGPSGSVDTSFIATTGSNTFIGNQTITGNVTVSGTASINTLVVNQTVLSTGSNQLGDAPNDTQTLYGSVIIPTGSLTISGSTVIRSNTFPNTDSVFQVLSGRTTSSLKVVNDNSIEFGANRKIILYPDVSNNSGAFISLANSNKSYELYSNNANNGCFFIYNRTDSKSPIVVTPDKIGLGVDTNFSSTTLAGAALIVTASNVGIGTSAPTQKLHVSGGNAFVNGTIYFGDSSHYLTTDNSTYALLSSNRNLQLGRSGVAALTVASTNNILIGTTTDSGYKLDVSGSGNFSNNLTVTGSLTTTGNIQANGFYTNAANGVGISSPATAIRISTNDNGANIIANSTPYFTFGNNGTAITRTSGTGKWFELASFVSFSPTSGTTTMDWLSIAPTINQTGGANGITRGIYVNPTLTSAADFRAIESTAGNVLFGASGTGFFWDNTNTGLILGGGSLDANNILQINGTKGIRISGTGAGIGYSLVRGTEIAGLATGTTFSLLYSTTQLRFETAANERMRIFANGNVGIGTTTDAGYKLDVSGSLRVNGTGLILDGNGPNIGSNGSTIYMTPSIFTIRSVISNDSGDVKINDNLVIGQNTDGSSRLHVRGSGTTSATTALRVENSNASASMVVLDNGNVGIGTATPGYTLDVNGTARIVSNLTIGQGAYMYAQGYNNLFFPFQYGASSIYGASGTSINNSTPSGTKGTFYDAISFAPVSGTADFSSFLAAPTINQTGGASGVTRGLYINPTLTAAADFRAIDSTNGRVVIADTATVTGSNATSLLDLSQTWNTSGAPIGIKLNITDTASAALSDLINLQVGGATRFRVVKSGFFSFNTGGDILGNLCVGGSAINASSQLEVRSTTKGFLPPRMTNAQRVAISTPAVGLMVYCTDATEGLYIYKSTGWTFIV